MTDVVRHWEKPADFSFMKFKQLKEEDPDIVSTARIGIPPPKSTHNKLLTKALWLNNNKLKSLKNLELFLFSVMENYLDIAWLDLSYNKLKEIDIAITNLPNLQILYLHGNHVDDAKEVLKLKALKNLRTLTLHGNPIYCKRNYRIYTITVLPQICSLDFTRITPPERQTATSFERKVE